MPTTSAIIEMMKKYVLILLLCIHFYMLFSQLVYWMLDINYGDLYYIGESLFSRTKIGYDAVESLYNQIMFGMYYSILSSIILILLVRKYYKKMMFTMNRNLLFTSLMLCCSVMAISQQAKHSCFTNNLDADALRRMIDKLLRLNTNSHLIFK